MRDKINYSGGPSLSKFLGPHSEHTIIAGYFCGILTLNLIPWCLWFEKLHTQKSKNNNYAMVDTSFGLIHAQKN